MWYSDPFIALPVTFAQAALISFAIMVAATTLKFRATRIIALIFACCFTFVSASSYFLGYYIKHSEEVNKWIGAILGG